MVTNFNMKIFINTIKFKNLFTRFLTSLSIFAITIFFTPNFYISSFSILILSSITITILDYFLTTLIGIEDFAFAKGILGFLCATFVIYITQFLVAGYEISLVSSMIASLIYGIIDSLLPEEFKNKNYLKE